MMFTSLQPIPSFFLSFKHRLWYFKYLNEEQSHEEFWNCKLYGYILLLLVGRKSIKHYHLLLFETVFFQPENPPWGELLNLEGLKLQN